MSDPVPYELVHDVTPQVAYAEALEWATEHFGNQSQMKALGAWPTSNEYKRVHTPLMYTGLIEVGRRRYDDNLVSAWIDGLNKLSNIAQNRAMGLDDDDDS